MLGYCSINTCRRIPHATVFSQPRMAGDAGVEGAPEQSSRALIIIVTEKDLADG